jgi:hypothetical protein
LSYKDGETALREEWESDWLIAVFESRGEGFKRKEIS